MTQKERDKDITKPYALFNYHMHFSKAIQFETRPKVFESNMLGMARMKKDYTERFHPMILPNSRTLLTHTSVRLIVSSWESYCLVKVQNFKKYVKDFLPQNGKRR